MGEQAWLVFDDVWRDADARAVFDVAVPEVCDGTARVVALSGQSVRGFVVEGRGVLGSAALRCGLGIGPAAELDALDAHAFTERVRLLFGWNDISSTLRTWVEA